MEQQTQKVKTNQIQSRLNNINYPNNQSKEYYSKQNGTKRTATHH